MYQFEQDLQDVQLRINTFLDKQINNIDTSVSPLVAAMRYGLLQGGKRIRPFLVYATGRMLQVELATLDYAAAAIETIHAYSLIHDDLPAMDNDDLRRGKPTCHIAFDEATAILAGDALQSFAFELISNVPGLSYQQQLKLVKQLANSSGAQGMCLGQSLDLISEHKTISLLELEHIHNNKTGALLVAAVKMGFICSDHFENKQLEQCLINYAQAIGLAFQVQDDILDIESDSYTLGKTAGSDLIADKSTYPKLLGLKGAKQKALQLYQQSLNSLESIPYDTSALKQLAAFIINRKN